MSQPDHDDPVARTVAENQLGDLIAEAIPTDESMVMERDEGVRYARSLLAAYPSVRFETAKTLIEGPGQHAVHLRRLVITGPWEVDPTQH